LLDHGSKINFTYTITRYLDDIIRASCNTEISILIGSALKLKQHRHTINHRVTNTSNRNDAVMVGFLIAMRFSIPINTSPI